MNNSELKLKPYLFGLLLLATLALVGCGGGTGTATKSVTPGIAQLAVSPSSMNFGSVLVGDSKALPGTLTATNASVTVSSAAWSGEGYSVSGITFPTVVPAGQTSSGRGELFREHQFRQQCFKLPRRGGFAREGEFIFESNDSGNSVARTIG